MATFTVTNNTDGGPGSLRQAILDSNVNVEADTIDFNISVGATAGFITPFNSPAYITTGPDGNLWFTENNPVDAQVGIGRLTIDGAISSFPVANGPFQITTGPDGNLWFTENGSSSIGRITTGGTVTEFPSGAFEPYGITAGPDGNLWFTDSNNLGTPQIGRITTDGTVTLFSTPFGFSQLLGITAGPDGNLWFSDDAGFIGQITTAGIVTEFFVGGSPISGIAAGSDGNLWFTERDQMRIGRITTSGTVTFFPVPSGGEPIEITAGPDGNLWFTELSSSNVGRITPTGTVTEFPTTLASIFFNAGITAGPDGNVWFTSAEGNQIGRVTVASSGTTITPASALPHITDPVVIDGHTQPGYAGTPLIELDGTNAGVSNGLAVDSANDGVIRALTVNRFNGDGIQLNGASRWVIAGNFIGTDRTGTFQRSNGQDGIRLNDFSAANTIGGTSSLDRNVISGNGSEGVQIQGLVTNTNLVIGNFIGTDRTGTVAVANALSGVILNGNASGNTVGGAAPGAGNLISGNLEYGIRVLGP